MPNVVQEHVRVPEKPARSAKHDALEVFLGDWKAEGQSYGGPDQDPEDARGRATRWTSTHTARWHTGRFFLIQDERAHVDGPFDTLTIMGWDEAKGRYFARSFENHGYYRHYEVTGEVTCGRSAAKRNGRASSSTMTASGKISPGNGDRQVYGCRCATESLRRREVLRRAGVAILRAILWSSLAGVLITLVLWMRTSPDLRPGFQPATWFGLSCALAFVPSLAIELGVAHLLLEFGPAEATNGYSGKKT
jgi:hypothetical protein